MRSLDFTVCTRVCSADCWRKLTKEEEDWLAVNPIFQSYSNFPDCKEYKYKEYESDIPMIDEVENNNEPDYEDNLVFPPQEIKSQDDIKHQEGRQSEVLIKAIEKCEKLEEEIKRYQSAIMSIEYHTAAMGGDRLEMIRALGDIDDICKEALS
jgi:hypothetical protein